MTEQDYEARYEPPALDIGIKGDCGPTLLYVHTEHGSSTFVDKTAPTDPRERALCRALLVHALTVLDAAEQAQHP